MSASRFTFDANQNQYRCQGDWTILHLKKALEKVKANPIPDSKLVIFNGEDISKLDSAGAFVLLQCIEFLEKKNCRVKLEGFNKHQLDLMDLASKKKVNTQYKSLKRKTPGIFYEIGVETIHKRDQANGLLILIGDMTMKILKIMRHKRRIQWASIFSNMASTGLYALPILAMLSFLVGVVLAYQMGLQLETYGATIFISYLSGMAIFREFGPLITAIIAAGRTGSAFTAQIGSMKINEEIDALHTMGLSPTELLVIPKVVGLTIMFPLLIFWSDVFAVMGAMIMSKYKLNVGYQDFLIRLQDSVGFKQMMLGLYKAPAFSILIALVGCFQGFQVSHSADSVGSQTTRSVVQALFLIIVTDAIYSVIYSWQGL